MWSKWGAKRFANVIFHPNQLKWLLRVYSLRNEDKGLDLKLYDDANEKSNLALNLFIVVENALFFLMWKLLFSYIKLQNIL